jgi:hypothetical protein
MSLSLRGLSAGGIFQDFPMAAPSIEEIWQNMIFGRKTSM